MAKIPRVRLPASLACSLRPCRAVSLRVAPASRAWWLEWRGGLGCGLRDPLVSLHAYASWDARTVENNRDSPGFDKKNACFFVNILQQLGGDPNRAAQPTSKKRQRPPQEKRTPTNQEKTPRADHLGGTGPTIRPVGPVPKKQIALKNKIHISISRAPTAHSGSPVFASPSARL